MTTNKFRQEIVTWTKQLGLFDDPKVVQALAEISKREDSDPPSPNAPLSAALDEWIKWHLDSVCLTNLASELTFSMLKHFTITNESEETRNIKEKLMQNVCHEQRNHRRFAAATPREMERFYEGDYFFEPNYTLEKVIMAVQQLHDRNE